MIAPLFALALALEVHGATTCPTPAEVAQPLSRLLPEDRSAGPALHAHLADGAGFVTIQLLTAEGVLVSDRRLDRQGSCAELAEAVAVILATWRATLSPRVAPMVVDVVAEPPTKPVSPATTVPTPRSPVRFDVGMSALSSFVGSQAAFGGKLESVILPFRGGLGIHGSLSLAADHTQDTSVATVRATWGRMALGLGPLFRVQGNTLAVDLHGNAVLARLDTQGKGLDKPAADTSVQLGLAGGARGLWTGRKSAAWVGVDLLGFPGNDNLTLGNRVPVGRLPHLEYQICLGIAFGRFR